MPRPAEFRCDVSTPELLAALLAEPLPLGLVVRELERTLSRDVYVDTADKALAGRGIACRIRYGADDRRTITLGLAEPGLPVAGPSEQFEAETPALDLAAILAGDSEPARRLRGAGRPVPSGAAARAPDRSRGADRHPAWHLPGRVAFLYDRVSVRSGRLTREFQELKVRRLSPDGRAWRSWRARSSRPTSSGPRSRPSSRGRGPCSGRWARRA